MSRVCREKQTPDWENSKEVHYNVLPKMQCRTAHRAVFSSVRHKTELLGVKVTTDFQGQCRINLITMQSVNCKMFTPGDATR